MVQRYSAQVVSCKSGRSAGFCSTGTSGSHSWGVSGSLQSGIGTYSGGYPHEQWHSHTAAQFEPRGKMAGVSAAYHTIISTCKMQGVSALQYFKMFFREIVNGRRDYDNLLPMTIGLCNNKL